MPEYDGEVVIRALLYKGDFEKALNELSILLEEKKSQIENLKAEYASYMDRTSKTKEQLYLEQEITKAQKERQAISDKLESPNIKFDDISILQKNLQELDEKLKILNKELMQVKLHPESTQSVKDLTKEISEAKREAENLQVQMNRAGKKASMPQTVNTSKMSSAMSKLAGSTKNFGNTFNKTFKSLKAPIEDVAGRITHLGKRIMRIASYVLFFNIIRGAFRQLRDYIGGLLGTNDEFMTSLNQIKSNLMVAFYPIYQYILPALNSLMKALVNASAYLAQFVSMLMGKDIKQSQEGAKALWEQSKAIKDGTSSRQGATKSVKDQKAAYDKLGKSIKGSKKELAAFDKLIVLQQNAEKEPKVKSPKDDGFVFSPTLAFDDTYDNILSLWGKIGEIIDNIKPKVIEIGNAFVNGFNFGFVDNNLGELQTKLGKIGGHLNEIFTNPEIQQGANDTMIAVVTAWGAWTGAFFSIGVTIARAWIGGIEKFLEENKEQIKKDLLKLFEVEINLANFNIDLSQAVANIYSVFGGEAAQKIVSDSLTIIYNIFVRWGLLLYQFFSDLIIQIFNPLITHQEELKVALEGTLNGIATIMDGLTDIIVSFTDTISAIYNDDLKPIIEEWGKIWDDTFGFIVENYNKHVNPMIKKLGEMIQNLSNEHIKPFLDTLKEMYDSWTDAAIPALKLLWSIIKPFVNWLISVVFEQLSSGIEWVAGIISSSIEDIITMFKGFADIFGGIFDIISGILTGDWGKVWVGAGKIVKGFGNVFISAINSVITAINAMTDGIRRGINSAINSFNSFHFDLPDWLGGGHVGFNIPTIPDNFGHIPKIPALAQGAVLKGGNPMLAYLNDQPRGQTNIETPLNTMIDAFNQALAQNNNNTGNVVIQADGDVAGIINMLRFNIKQRDELVGTNYIQDGIFA
ncbi:MAG: hypothetical protein K2N51_17115 [Lachnospiraceae bacterium]|nr:hypothetical protein [Lachnospiraceae bacterium]